MDPQVRAVWSIYGDLLVLASRVVVAAFLPGAFAAVVVTFFAESTGLGMFVAAVVSITSVASVLNRRGKQVKAAVRKRTQALADDPLGRI